MLFIPIVLAAMATTAAIAWYYDFFSKKSYCLVGPKASGKTTLFYFLIKGKFEKKHDSTQESENIADCFDMPGQESSVLSEWQKGIEAKEWCLYVFDTSKYYKKSRYSTHKNENETYDEIVKLHLNLINGYKKNKIIIIGTHTDKISYSDANIAKDDLARFLKSRHIEVDIKLGSLTSQASTKKLVEKIKEYMEEIDK